MSIRKLAMSMLALVLLSTATMASHPYHVSFAEVEWNSKTGNFEVALCVWPADLEKALARRAGTTLNLDTVDDLDGALETYVAERFIMQPVGQETDQNRQANASKIRWVGHEMNLKKAWLYFEIPGSTNHEAWKVRNRCFCELNEDQENHVQFKVGKRVAHFVASGEAKLISTSTE